METTFNYSADFYTWILVSLLQPMEWNRPVKSAVSLIWFIHLFQDDMNHVLDFTKLIDSLSIHYKESFSRT